MVSVSDNKQNVNYTRILIFLRGKLYMRYFLDIKVRETKICNVGNQTRSISSGVDSSHKSKYFLWTSTENNLKRKQHVKNHVIYSKGKQTFLKSLTANSCIWIPGD